jgi:large subunit ribosomal protein L30
MPATKKTATIRVQQIKSGIGYNRKKREVLKGMGLRKLHQIVELPDNDATRGMIAKVHHLVRTLEPAEAAGSVGGEEK